MKLFEKGWEHYDRPYSPRTGIAACVSQVAARTLGARGLDEVRPRITAADIPGFPVERLQGRGVPTGWYDWYDWVLVWRYWIGEATDLRRPYLLEQAELLRLGERLSNMELAERLGFSERQIIRWKQRLTVSPGDSARRQGAGHVA